MHLFSKSIRYLLPRLLASLIIVSSLTYVLYVRPQQSTDNVISNHVSEIQNLNDSLQDAKERLKLLPSPATIKYGEPGAKKHANLLDDSKGVFSASEVNFSSLNDNKIKKEKNTKPGALIMSGEYRSAVISSQKTLNAGQDFILHHASVMRALANLLEYNPSTDLSSDKEQEIYQRLEVAKAGLNRTLEKIEGAPKYENDKTLNESINLINNLQAIRQKLSESLSQPQYTKVKQDFISSVELSQKAIIENRAEFWLLEKNRITETIDSRQKKLSYYLQILESYSNP